MKRSTFIIALLTFSLGLQSFGQDSRALRAAKKSFDSAENSYKKENYREAAREYEIVIQTIPVSTDSRRNLEMRLESLINLTDIYLYHSVNINDACRNIQLYMSNMNTIRNKGILRANKLLYFQRKEKEFESEKLPKCESYQNIDNDMQNFEKKFNEEFE
jgi:hypothetical protein